MLKLTLKPGETVYIGRSRMIIESSSICDVYIEGDEPVLRGGEAVPEAAATPLAKLHLVLQQIYLTGDALLYIAAYRRLAKEVEAMSAHHAQLIGRIDALLEQSALYKAVKTISQATRGTAEPE